MNYDQTMNFPVFPNYYCVSKLICGTLMFAAQLIKEEIYLKCELAAGYTHACTRTHTHTV